MLYAEKIFWLISDLSEILSANLSVLSSLQVIITNKIVATMIENFSQQAYNAEPDLNKRIYQLLNQDNSTSLGNYKDHKGALFLSYLFY